MAFHQVREIMNKSCRQHEAVARFYKELQELAVDNVKLHYILGAMKEHEETIVFCIKEFLKNKNSNILNTWFQYLPDTPLPADSICPQDTIDEQTAQALFEEINSRFVAIYEKLADYSSSESVNELFLRMKSLTNHEGAREGWCYNMLADM